MDAGEINGRKLYTGLRLDYRLIGCRCELLHPHRALSLRQLSFLLLKLCAV